MKKQTFVTFYVPCLNEENTLGAVLVDLEKAAGLLGVSYDVVVVDDNSSDSSVDIALAAMTNMTRDSMTIVRNQQTMGIGFNYRTAATVGRGEFIMMVGADGSEDTKLIRTLLSALEEGLRNSKAPLDGVVPYFEDSRGAFRRLLSSLFAFIVRAISGVNFRYYNGPTVHRRVNVLRGAPTSSGFAFQAEMLVYLSYLRGNFIECPVKNIDRKFGKSRAFRLRSWVSVTNSLLKIMLLRLRFLIFPLNSGPLPLHPEVLV